MVWAVVSEVTSAILSHVFSIIIVLLLVLVASFAVVFWVSNDVFFVPSDKVKVLFSIPSEILVLGLDMIWYVLVCNSISVLQSFFVTL